MTLIIKCLLKVLHLHLCRFLLFHQFPWKETGVKEMHVDRCKWIDYVLLPFMKYSKPICTRLLKDILNMIDIFQRRINCFTRVKNWAALNRLKKRKEMKCFSSQISHSTALLSGLQMNAKFQHNNVTFTITDSQLNTKLLETCCTKICITSALHKTF